MSEHIDTIWFTCEAMIKCKCGEEIFISDETNINFCECGIGYQISGTISKHKLEQELDEQ